MSKPKGEVLATIPVDEDTCKRWRIAHDFPDKMTDALYQLMERAIEDAHYNRERMWAEAVERVKAGGFDMASPDRPTLEIDWLLRAIILRKSV